MTPQELRDDYGFSNMFGVAEYASLDPAPLEIPAFLKDEGFTCDRSPLVPEEVEIIKTVEGCPDGEDWLLFGKARGLYVVGSAGCDYTGFD